VKQVGRAQQLEREVERKTEEEDWWLAILAIVQRAAGQSALQVVDARAPWERPFSPAQQN
jgi:hypothetical protein